MSWAFIQVALSSVARTAIFPMQDILGLGNSARMNIPATQVSFVFPFKKRTTLSSFSLQHDDNKLAGWLLDEYWMKLSVYLFKG